MNIYVGNLSFKTTEDDLQQAFSAYGEITSVSIVKDKFSGESRGFGFVEMASKEAAQQALAELNGTEMHGRNITVNEAKPRTENRGRSGFRRNTGGGYRDNW